jgi:nucleotide-binding universal stress UspA family protein
MYRKILVPLDGSRLAECALDHTERIATGCNVPEVDLLYVSSPPTDVEGVPYGMFLSAMAKERERMRDYLHKIDRDLKQKKVAVARHMVLEGEPASTIVQYAVNNGVDLIVMSTHGRSGVSRWAFGSVAEKVIRTSSVPVMIVTPEGCRLKNQSA